MLLTGMIRLPKAPKAPPKNRPIPRPSLANIVKELGENSTFIQSVTRNVCVCGRDGDPIIIFVGMGNDGL